MSYILEALKKSDQQRQRGATPRLPAAQFTVAPPRRYYGLLAVVLLCIGIAIGWLHPWQTEHPEKEGIIVKSPIPIPPQAAPVSVPAELARKTAQELSVPKSTPAASPAVDRMKPDISVSAMSGTQVALPLMPEKASMFAGAPPEQRAIPMDELPLAIQQEIPAMAIQLHAYSSKPVERLVSINSRMLREGGFLTPELKLEQITPDGMIFSYKGYLFQRGIR